jgi:hypothetical protein
MAPKTTIRPRVAGVREQIQDHRKDCNDNLKMVYITWNRFLCILGSVSLVVLAGIGGTSWALSRQVTQIESKDGEQDRRIERLEGVVSSIRSMENDVRFIREQIINKPQY